MSTDWWNNCAIEADEEIVAIDGMEDKLHPLDKETIQIRKLITSLELCHHKAERWVELILESIASGKASRGPVGTRLSGKRHPMAPED